MRFERFSDHYCLISRSLSAISVRKRQIENEESAESRSPGQLAPPEVRHVGLVAGAEPTTEQPLQDSPLQTLLAK